MSFRSSFSNRASIGRQSISASVRELRIQSLNETDRSKADQTQDYPIDYRESITKPTLKRYIILFLFCLNSGNKSFQWIQIPAGTKKISYYYDVDNFVINGTSVIFLVSFIILSWPACFIIERIGIRRAVVIASFGTAVGSVIKCFSCREGGIAYLMIAQVLVSISEQLIFSVPPRLMSVWFPDHEVSSAMGLSIFGNQLGVALGFVIPQALLDGTETRAEIGHALELMFYGTAALSIFAFVANYLLFNEAPKYPPGAARLKQMHEERMNESTGQSIWADIGLLGRQLGRLMKDGQIMLLNMSFGVGMGLYSTIATVLNQMLELIWPGDDILVGNTGFCIIIFGALGSIIWGQVLDRSHKYRLVNIILQVATILSVVFFCLAMIYLRSQYAVYVAAALLGIFQVGFMVAGMEMAVELSYPAPELVTASLMNVTPQIFGTIFIFVASYIVDNHGVIASNAFYLFCAVLSLVFLLGVKENLRRQKAVLEKMKSSITKSDKNAEICTQNLPSEEAKVTKPEPGM